MVLKQRALPVISYGVETWRLAKHLERKLGSANLATERGMIRVTLRDSKHLLGLGSILGWKTSELK